jgi:hypothetical protein
MKLNQTLFVLPLLLAATITSCVDTGYYGGPRQSYGGASVSAGRGYYTTLPSNYVGSAYFYNGRYYSGGNYQTGNYTYQGRTYNNRYYQNGQYLYGGVHQHHGSPGSQHASHTAHSNTRAARATVIHAMAGFTRPRPTTGLFTRPDPGINESINRPLP